MVATAWGWVLGTEGRHGDDAAFGERKRLGNDPVCVLRRAPPNQITQDWRCRADIVSAWVFPILLVHQEWKIVSFLRALLLVGVFLNSRCHSPSYHLRPLNSCDDSCVRPQRAIDGGMTADSESARPVIYQPRYGTLHVYVPHNGSCDLVVFSQRLSPISWYHEHPIIVAENFLQNSRESGALIRSEVVRVADDGRVTAYPESNVLNIALVSADAGRYVQMTTRYPVFSSLRECDQYLRAVSMGGP